MNARWQVDGTEHTGSLTMDHAVKTGDPLMIWVDRDGDRVDAPTPTSQAGVDAVGVAYAAWQAVVLAAAGLVCWGRSRLDRRRDSAWERDIRCLIDDGGSGQTVRPDRSFYGVYSDIRLSLTLFDIDIDGTFALIGVSRAVTVELNADEGCERWRLHKHQMHLRTS